MVEDLNDFSKLAKDFQISWNYFKGISNEEDTYSELCSLRFYQDPKMLEVLKDVGFCKLPETVDLEPLKKLSSYSSLGLETKTGRCLLGGRFVFPVRDMLGNILALIGWYPDEKKYITTPSKYFNRSCLFFGLEQLKDGSKDDIVFVCEGIFDSLSLRSMGYKAFATMGVELSRQKKMLYPILGKRVVGISDRDKVGNSVRDYDRWSCWKYLTWVGEYEVDSEDIDNIKIKDVDDLVKLFEPDTIREIFDEELKNNPSKVVKLEL